MTIDAEKQQLIVRATSGLKLRDISLLSAVFNRPAAGVGALASEMYQQHKRGVAFTQGVGPAEDGTSKRLLQVRVSLGTRVVHDPKSDAPRVFFMIEADFLVEYEMLEDVPEDALSAFTEFNAVHNVWPFWRYHVFDVVERGRLPRLDVPLFAGVVT